MSDIFVTGGTGFIGSHFVKLALARGHFVRALRRCRATPRIALPREPVWIEGDLESVPANEIQNCNVLVHFAAAGVQPQEATWAACLRWNLMAAHQVLREAADAGIQRVILCGSCFEYGLTGESYEYIPTNAPLLPVGPYASSKAAATVAAIGLATERKLLLSVLRPFHVFGEGEHTQRFWPSLRKAALAGEDFPMTAGAQIRDFTPVETIAACFVSELESAAPLPSIPRFRNLGTGTPRSLAQFAGQWWRHFQAEGTLKIGALPYRPNEVMRYVPDLRIDGPDESLPYNPEQP